jgi:hypothetical protein
VRIVFTHGIRKIKNTSHLSATQREQRLREKDGRLPLAVRGRGEELESSTATTK